jgi:hypothetical protein
MDRALLDTGIFFEILASALRRAGALPRSAQNTTTHGSTRGPVSITGPLRVRNRFGLYRCSSSDEATFVAAQSLKHLVATP